MHGAFLSVMADGDFEYALAGGVAVIVNEPNRYTIDVDALVWDLDVRFEELLTLLNERGIVSLSVILRGNDRCTIGGGSR